MVGHRDGTASPCPNCGGKENDEKFSRLELDAKKATWMRPAITEADLTDKERKVVESWRFQLPDASTITLLSWIEGQRFDERAALADKEFQKQLFHALAEWREATGRGAA